MRDATTAHKILDARTALGEGLHWDSHHACLWMVDIHGQRLLRWEPGCPQHEEWAAPEPIGWVLPRGETLLVGLPTGVAIGHLQHGKIHPEWVARLHDGQPHMRLNDAKMDRTGAIWAGSLNRHDETQPDGCLYRLAPDGRLDRMDDGYTVANGPALRADERLMLHTDSVRRIVYAFDLDTATGRICGKRVWREFGPDEGHPDGMTFDDEGCVWIAHWGAGRVCRYDGDGRLLRQVGVPALNVTNVCFFGTARDRLAVSSARNPPTAPHDPGDAAGSVFEVLDPGARGIA